MTFALTSSIKISVSSFLLVNDVERKNINLFFFGASQLGESQRYPKNRKCSSFTSINLYLYLLDSSCKDIGQWLRLKKDFSETHNFWANVMKTKRRFFRPSLWRIQQQSFSCPVSNQEYLIKFHYIPTYLKEFSKYSRNKTIRLESFTFYVLRAG